MFIRENPSFPKRVIATWHKGIYDALLKKYDSKTICSFTSGVVCPVHLLMTEPTRTALCLIPSSSANAAMFMETMRSYGAQSFFFIGTCANLTDKKTDDIFVPTSCLCDENTGSCYLDHDEILEIPEAEKTIEILRGIAPQRGLGVRKVRVWTTDAPFRETESKVREALEKSCQCVDMECSAIRCVTDSLHLTTHHILIPSDLLSSKTWKEGTLRKKNRTSSEVLSEIILLLSQA